MARMSDPHRDMMPMHEAQHTFDVVLRGYDKHQVAETIERLEADFRIAIADRDAAVGRSADLASQLSALHGEIESLRRKAATAAAPTFENMSERISHMLRLAEEEAADIRRLAGEDAQAVREQTAAEERAMHERHAAGQAEVERMLAEARQNAEQIATKAQIRADELVQKAQERVARLDAESQARRAKAEEDFEIAQRAKRAEAARQDEERERVSTAAARQRVAEAQQHAAQIVAEAEAKAAAIRDVRDELTSRLLQARQLLSTLPDLGDRPQASTERPAPPTAERPAEERRPEPTGPQTNQLTVRTAEGESAAARQPIRHESPSPAPRPTGPATTVQPAVTADQAAGSTERRSETPTGGARMPVPPRTASPTPTGHPSGATNPAQGPPTQVIETPSSQGRR
jgi:cell division septum initiation protein DivIVA